MEEDKRIFQASKEFNIFLKEALDWNHDETFDDKLF